MRFFGYFSLILFVQQAGAAQSQFQGTTKNLSLQDVANWAASLIVVLAIFLFCVWVIRKTQHLSTAQGQTLKVVTGLALGMREKLVLVQVGEKQILLGVTPGRIEKLLILEGDAQLKSDSTPTAGAFAKKLAQVMKGSEQ